MSESIATIPKNTLEDVRVSLSEFKGKRLIDVRTYTEVNDGKERVPTKKGVSLAIELLPELLDALNAAGGQAKAKGWHFDEVKA